MPRRRPAGGVAAGGAGQHAPAVVIPTRLRYPRTLVTGAPGTGKTTLIQGIVERLPALPLAGFTTAEIRSGGNRVGFELRGLDGRRRILAHVNLESRHWVGRYGVDTAGFEAFLTNLDLLNPRVALVVIDEIGRMELFSRRFRTLLRNVLDSDKMLLASIALRGEGIIQEIKRRPDVHLTEISRANRNHLLTALLEDARSPSARQ